MRSLKAKESELAEPAMQLKLLSETNHIPKFEDKLRNAGLFPLKPTAIEILQVNVGYLCNQICSHCHVDAGPDRKEVMTQDTMKQCLQAIDNSAIRTVDITGGAPEMNPHFLWFVEELSKRNVKIMVRSNLTILVANKKFASYPDFFKTHRVTVIASMPCYTMENIDKQRGKGVFSDSIRALQRLNELGYGKEGSGLELHLVYNPAGAFISPPQEQLRVDYKRELKKLNVEFNDLYTITNLPLSRFLDHLLVIGKYEEYMETLANAFNPAAAEGVMCRNTVSVGWDGNLYDCDFNQMLELKVAENASQLISEFDIEKLMSREIVLNRHCYGCTAGAGSSCQGAIV